MIDYQETDRDKAIADVLAVVRHPLAVMSVPDRETAYALAAYHDIRAADLLNFAVKRARQR
jgi:hypothetical protein